MQNFCFCHTVLLIKYNNKKKSAQRHSVSKKKKQYKIVKKFLIAYLKKKNYSI